ncbi:hypothetical protein [Sinomonas flava]
MAALPLLAGFETVLAAIATVTALATVIAPRSAVKVPAVAE